MKKFIGTILLGLSGILTLSAAYPKGYYDSLNGKKGTDLKKAVQAVAVKGFTAISYGDKTWQAFRSTDVRTVNGVECWWDMYSNNNVPITGHSGMNIEHSVANSWWDGTKNNAYKDIVHLNPSDATANNRKSNYPLSEIATVTWDNGVTFVGNPKSGQGGGSNYVYEPHDMYKGDFARVFMYIFTAYADMAWGTRFTWMYDTSSPLLLKPWAYQLLLRWAANDPVSQKELDRNDGIYKEQHNRNPFIDLPDLGEYIWGSKQGEVFYVENSVNPDPVDPDDPIDPDDPDDPDNPDVPTPAVEGTWTLVTSGSQLEDGALYLILSNDNGAAMGYTITGTSNTYFPKITTTPTVSDNTITTLTADLAVVKLSGSDGRYTMYVQDTEGNGKGYIVCSAEKKMGLSDDSGNTVLFTISPDGSASLFFSDNVGDFQYNSGSPRFTTYKNKSQKPLHLFKYNPKEEPNPPTPPVFELESPEFYVVNENGMEMQDGDRFGKMCLVELRYSGENSDADIYYTLDGSQPEVSAEASQSAPVSPSTIKYTEPFILTATTTVKAVGAKNGTVSDPVESTFIYDGTSRLERIDDSVLVEVWGNNIFVPEDAVIHDLNGRRVNGTNVARGIYIVTSRHFRNPVKVMVK